MRSSAFLLLAISVPAAWTGEIHIRFKLTGREVIAARISDAPMENGERGQRLKELFAQAGCPADKLSTQPVANVDEPNVICTVPGETDSEIVVGAHFDHVKHGRGVIDNWSGASLLASLLESVRAAPRQHTFVFVGFTAEERGLLESAY